MIYHAGEVIPCMTPIFCFANEIKMYLLQFIDVGIVTRIEANHKQLETATKGMEVCLKIEPMPGEAPKMYGRHFDYTDLIVSKVSELNNFNLA